MVQVVEVLERREGAETVRGGEIPEKNGLVDCFSFFFRCYKVIHNFFVSKITPWPHGEFENSKMIPVLWAIF